MVANFNELQELFFKRKKLQELRNEISGRGVASIDLVEPDDYGYISFDIRKMKSLIVSEVGVAFSDTLCKAVNMEIANIDRELKERYSLTHTNTYDSLINNKE